MGEFAGTPSAVGMTAAASGSGDVAMVATTPGLRFVGFACQESAGSPAVANFRLRHGAADSAPILAPVELNSNESAREWWYPGVDAPNGIFLERTAGSTEVTVFHMVVR